MVWAAIFARLRRGLPILPYEPRRPVPWTALDLAVFLLVYLLVSVFAVVVVALPAESPTSAPAGGDRVVGESSGDSVDIAVNVDEAEEEESEPADGERLKTIIIVDIATKLFTCAFAVVWLRRRCNATAADFGLVRSKIAGDVVLGVTAFLALMLPVYVIQLAMTQLITPSRHPLIIELQNNPEFGLLVLGAIAAVITAPIVEEFAFRLLLQGWLEALMGPPIPEGNVNKHAATDVSAGSVLEGDGEKSQNGAANATSEQETRDLETFPAAMTEFDEHANEINPYSPPAIEPAEVPDDVKDDSATGQTVWAPILFSSLFFLLPHAMHGGDFAALFVLAMGLGYIYQRTHRIVPCIVVHLCLNATSMLMLWFAMRQ